MKSNRRWTLVGRVLAGLCAWGMCLGAQARQWTNDKGGKIEAEYVSSDGKEVVLMLNGKNVSYELARLSEADRLFVKDKMKAVAVSVPVQTGWIQDFPISKPAFVETKGYLVSKNAKAVYKAFKAGEFPKEWTVNKQDVEKEFAYDAASATAIVYVPKAYDGTAPMGVYLHVSAGDAGENMESYAPVMDRLKMIYISAKGTSNDQPMLRRVKLAVDALASVKEKWKIDPKRVCVGGYSGGGHMGMLIHAMYPGTFVGAVSHAAQSYLPAEGTCGHFPGLVEGDLKSRDFKGHKWCVISGDKDQNYQEILTTSKKWEKGRFDYRFFDIPGMGHENAAPEKLEQALKWLGM